MWTNECINSLVSKWMTRVRGRSRAIGSCEANNYCVSIKELPLTVVHLVHANPFLSSLVVWGFAARPHNTGHMTPNILCELYIHHDYYSHIKHMCSCLVFFFFFFLAFDFCRFCIVIRFFHPHRNVHMTSDFEGFLYQNMVWRGPWLGIEPGTSRTRCQPSTTRLSRRRYVLL